MMSDGKPFSTQCIFTLYFSIANVLLLHSKIATSDRSNFISIRLDVIPLMFLLATLAKNNELLRELKQTKKC